MTGAARMSARACARVGAPPFDDHNRQCLTRRAGDYRDALLSIMVHPSGSRKKFRGTGLYCDTAFTAFLMGPRCRYRATRQGAGRFAMLEHRGAPTGSGCRFCPHVIFQADRRELDQKPLRALSRFLTPHEGEVCPSIRTWGQGWTSLLRKPRCGQLQRCNWSC